MSRITKTFTQSETWTIPSNATNIRFAIGGAAGGSCPGVRGYYSPNDPNYNATKDANCQLNPQSTGQYGQWIVGDLKGSLAGTSITFVRGLKGDDNLYVYGSSTDPGAPGGAGYHDGGDGGPASDTSSTGVYDCTRSGGAGGGGSSVFLAGGTVIVEAGGGAGAGGANTGSLKDPDSVNAYTRSFTYGNSGFNGRTGGTGGANNCAGSGGGGGGYSNGGSSQSQINTQMNYGDGGIDNNGSYGRGFPGIGGSGFVNRTYVDGFPTSYNSNEAQHTKELQGTAEISYETKTVIEDFDWTTRSAQEDGTVGPQGSDPNNAWTSFLSNFNIGGQESEGVNVTRVYEWEINFNNTGFQVFNTAVDDAADVYIDNTFQFSLNTYNSNDIRTTPTQITAGQHTLRIEHVNTGGPYGVAMDWTGYTASEPPIVSMTAEVLDANGNVVDVPNVDSTNSSRTGTDEIYVAGSSNALQKLDVSYFAGGTKYRRPVVIGVHGGAFRQGDKDSFDNNNIKGTYFTNLGYNYVSLNYRLSVNSNLEFAAPPNSANVILNRIDFTDASWNRLKIDDLLDDIATAVKWVIDNESTYNFDVNNIAILGHSAGAHLVAALATRSDILSGKGVSVSTIKGVIVMDTDGFDIVDTIGGAYNNNNGNVSNSKNDWMFMNVYGVHPNIPGASGLDFANLSAANTFLTARSILDNVQDSNKTTNDFAQSFCLLVRGQSPKRTINAQLINALNQKGLGTRLLDYGPGAISGGGVTYDHEGVQDVIGQTDIPNDDPQLASLNLKNINTEIASYLRSIFSADVSIWRGEDIKLSYSSTVPALSDPITSNDFFKVDANGTTFPIPNVGTGGVYFPPTLQINSTFTYSATNAVDTSFVSKTIAIIADASAPTVSLTTEILSNGVYVPVTNIYSGQTIRITYSASVPSNGDPITSYTFTATDINGNVTNPIGSVGASGVYFPAPTVTTTYSYSATNANGTTPISQQVVVVDDTPIVTLVSDDSDNIINVGDSITLTWGATSNTTITSTTMTGVASPGTSGSETFTPTSAGTYTYIFTATNASGTGSIELTVTVVLSLPTASLTSNDPQGDDTIILGDAQSGDPITLTWNATGSNISSYTMTGVTNPGASGAIVVNPTVTTTYTYTVTNPSGTVSDDVTITVYNRPVITRFDAPTNTIARGTGVVLTWETTGDASSIQWVNGTPIPSNTNVNGTAFVSPQNSTQYCIVASGNGGVSETVCYNINVIVPDSSITDYDTTFTDDGTVYIPPYAINVTADIAGASGGSGGTDSGGSGGGSGAGRRALIFFPDYVERTFTLRLGNSGGNGFGCVANSGAGGGGSSNVAAGGSGGRSGPSGCSGGGGGGGGASAIFDSLKNGYVVVTGGGGGGGGASWNRSATSGQTGLGMTNGNLNNISSGSNGANCPNDGGGGGGGGGGANPGSSGPFGLDNDYGGSGGGGGGSAYDNSYCSFNSNTGTQNFGDGFARVRYDIGSPEITSFTSDFSAIIRGVGVTLSWTSLFSITGSIDQGVGSVQVPNGSILFYPQNTGTYTLTVVGPGGINTDTASLSITVYIPPVLTITLNSPTIIVGGSTQISWSTSGDANTLTWVTGGITNTNLTSNTTVSPSVTTTYSGYASGLGGTSPLASVTLVVYYPPTLLVNYPAQIDYGQQAQIDYSGDYANSSVVLNVTYNYDYVAATTDTADLNKSDSAEFGSNSGYSGIYDTDIPYTERGPLSVSYTITATGNGGLATQSFTIPINVDITPDNMTIEESEDLFKDQVPVVTPDSEILGDYYEVQDVDILVEVKSDYPINVDIDANDNWQQVRQI